MRSGTKVVISNFGSHIGTVESLHPQYDSWLVVKLDDGRTWNGHRKLVRRFRAKTAVARNEFLAIA